MFSAVSHSPHDARAETPADVALKRLNGIGDVLADLDVAGLRTHDEMTRALWTLDTADKCIRAVLAEVRTAPVTDHLMRKSESLLGLIELARSEIACATAPMLQVEPASLLVTSRA